MLYQVFLLCMTLAKKVIHYCLSFCNIRITYDSFNGLCRLVLRVMSDDIIVRVFGDSSIHPCVGKLT